MKPALVWTPQAREDLIEIYVTIGLDNEPAAERLYAAIAARAVLLIDHPRLGVRRPEIAPTPRMLVEGVYLILYEPIPTRTTGRSKKLKLFGSCTGIANSATCFED